MRGTIGYSLRWLFIGCVPESRRPLFNVLLERIKTLRILECQPLVRAFQVLQSSEIHIIRL